MNIDELLACDRELTNEEFEFLEQHALAAARAFQDLVEDMINPKMEKEAPELANKLRTSAARMVSSLEIAVSIPLD